jgi:hypothetical protein
LFFFHAVTNVIEVLSLEEFHDSITNGSLRIADRESTVGGVGSMLQFHSRDSKQIYCSKNMD